MPSIDPRHDVSAEMQKQLHKQMITVRRFGPFQRKGKMVMKMFEPERMKGGVEVHLPFANTVLPLVIVFPAISNGLNSPPEIYFHHEKFAGFAPELDRIRDYGRSPVEPLDRDFATVVLLREFCSKAAAFQVLLLRENEFAAEEVKNSISNLHEILPDSFQVLLTQTEVHWLVNIEHNIAVKDNELTTAYGALIGTTSLASLAETKITMEFYGDAANVYKEMRTPLSVPQFDPVKGPLHQFLMDLQSNLEQTTNDLYLAKRLNDDFD